MEREKIYEFIITFIFIQTNNYDTQKFLIHNVSFHTHQMINNFSL
jgi:hypothetical protein